MTFKNFAWFIRKQSGTSATTFLDADLIKYANIYKDEIARRIVRRKQDVFGMPMTINLGVDVNGNPIREIPLDKNSIQDVKHVEAKLDGTNWVPLTEMDLVGYRGVTDETYIQNKFGNGEGECFYDLFRGSLWIYSGKFGAVTDGLKLWTFNWPADIVSLAYEKEMSIDPSGTSAGMPREFRELWARRVIIAKKAETDKPQKITDSEKLWELSFQRALIEFSAEGPIYAKMESDGYDNGFNL